LEEQLQGNERGAEALGSAPLFKLTFAEFDIMSYYSKTIKHVVFNKEWIKAGD
jgi:hypothetical protein